MSVPVCVCLWIEFPHEKACVSSARHKASVVFEPTETLDWLGVTVELELNRALRRVELVDPDLLFILASEKMTTVGENDFTALANRQILVGHETVVQDIH